jgi:hypothetical protein
MLKLGLTVFYASLQSHDLLFKRCYQCEKLFIADFLLNFCFFLFGTEILFLLFLHISFDFISYFLDFYSRVGLSNQGDDLFVLVDEVIDKILLSGHPLVFGLQVGHFALLKFILIRGLFL